MVVQNEHIRALARDLDKSEAELREIATQVGLRQLWRERVLGQLVRGEISRQQAIHEVGLDWVILTEQQVQATKEDLAWAMQPPSRQ